MPDVSFDGHAFLVERRRVFLVGGTVHHAASPAAEWPRRLAAARRAGLNCIETAVPWLLHEPAPGEFDFSGRADLAAFLRLAGEAGLFVRLRMGPYVGAGFGGGGLPAWLPEVPITKKSGPMKARESSDPFMAACTRWYTRLMKEVAPLQVSASRVGDATPAASRADAALGPAAGYRGEGGGPVLAMQSEHRWLCHSPAEHANYHRTLIRFLLEGGARVPITAANQLWQPVDGAVQTWSSTAGAGSADAETGLAGTARQLAGVQPGRPRIVEILPGPAAPSAGDELAAAAEVLAVGAMPHLGAFGGGRRLGFDGGLDADADPAGDLIDSAGRPRDGFHALRRLLCFASCFGNALGQAEPAAPTPVLRPRSVGAGVTLLPVGGEAGGALFLFAGSEQKADAAEVLLPDGRTLRVPLGEDRLAWVARDLRLGAKGRIGHATLPLVGFFHDALLVLVGPAGKEGELELNGALHRLPVPAKGDAEPAVVPLGAGVHAVVLNEQQHEGFAVVAEGVCLGVDPFEAPAESADADPAEAADAHRVVPAAATLRPAAGRTSRLVVGVGGGVETTEQVAPRRPPAPKLGAWAARGTSAEADGTAAGYKPVPAVGTPARHDPARGDAYGWLTLDNPGAAAARTEPTVFPGGPCRLHVFSDGKPVAVVGPGGDGARCDPPEVALGGRTAFLVAGGVRPSGGLPQDQAPGLAAPPVSLKEVELGEPEVTTTRAPDPFKISGYVPGRSSEDAPLGSRVAYGVKLLGKKPLFLRGPVPAAGTVVLNGTPVARFGPDAGACPHWRIDPAAEGSKMKAGTNELVFHFDAVLADPVAALGALRAWREEADRTPSGKGVWSFCPWRVPGFEGDAPKPAAGLPVWHRCTFSSKRLDFPLFLEPVGLTRGVVLLNGHAAARYRVAGPGEKAPPKPAPIHLPTGWLSATGENELVLFDEHGASASKAKLRWG
ncbi:beta-galactosidase [Phycisphaera mikurensis]|uniref:Putative glycoside hydrolase n=1 Tax=Phycisphaera mikurensis (strain NBRC 102666 / KCTC 22515 / FYK2301M01) TaxID=1142394 RepID=I0IEW2_PHYMF|nr:beta-galactosidase [Phycisphaera mikurensis]MBB6441595.1 beta-galactosidase [Phycisphaera mikurensis]BAM03800.1 putative glycoside hydrolase [Phycisphaera mikurensis NBRC 102666]